MPAGFSAVQVYSLLSIRRTSVILREPEGRTVNLGSGKEGVKGKEMEKTKHFMSH